MLANQFLEHMRLMCDTPHFNAYANSSRIAQVIDPGVEEEVFYTRDGEEFVVFTFSDRSTAQIEA